MCTIPSSGPLRTVYPQSLPLPHHHGFPIPLLLFFEMCKKSLDPTTLGSIFCAPLLGKPRQRVAYTQDSKAAPLFLLPGEPTLSVPGPPSTPGIPARSPVANIKWLLPVLIHILLLSIVGMVGSSLPGAACLPLSLAAPTWPLQLVRPHVLVFFMSPESSRSPLGFG